MQQQSFVVRSVTLTPTVPEGRAQADKPGCRRKCPEEPSRELGFAFTMADELRVSRSCSIPLGELEWRFTGSGGPGGQHANTANTKVELRFDVLKSEALGP